MFITRFLMLCAFLNVLAALCGFLYVHALDSLPYLVFSLKAMFFVFVLHIITMCFSREVK